MVINHLEAHVKLEKLAKNTDTFQFALSPEGFLLVSKGNIVEVSDFKLFHNGKYYHRSGFKFRTNFGNHKKGMFLCSFGKEKFVANFGEENFEYASSKKKLSPEFSLIMFLRFTERIVLLIADGNFSNTAHLVTLNDTSNNEAFARSLMRVLVGSRSETAVEMLYLNAEENENVEKTEEN